MEKRPEEGQEMMTVESLRAQHQTQPPAFKRGKEYLPNMYAGTCTRCSNRVEAGQGYRDKVEGKWIVFHKQCPTQQQSLPIQAVKEVTTGVRIPLKRPLVEGYYTVVFDDGDRRTIRARMQYADAAFMPSTMLLSYLNGPNNESDYTRFANVTEQGYVKIWSKYTGSEKLIEAVKVLGGDPEAAMKAYGLESGRCGVCGRLLTDPESIALGIGPVCAGKAWS